MEDYSDCNRYYWALRDSLTNRYSKEDPLREQFWQMWVNKEAELNAELLQKLNNKWQE